MMIKRLIPFAMLLLLVTPVLSQTFEYCKDNTTLVHIKQVTINVPEKNITRTFNVTEDQTCQYGCDTLRNECIQPPFYRYLTILGIIVFIIAIIIIFWRVL